MQLNLQFSFQAWIKGAAKDQTMLLYDAIFYTIYVQQCCLPETTSWHAPLYVIQSHIKEPVTLWMTCRSAPNPTC